MFLVSHHTWRIEKGTPCVDLTQKVQMISDDFAAQVGFEVKMEAVEKNKSCAGSISFHVISSEVATNPTISSSQ